jgi:hypothetical protein
MPRFTVITGTAPPPSSELVFRVFDTKIDRIVSPGYHDLVTAEEECEELNKADAAANPPAPSGPKRLRH